jgi:two-component system cell cycle response regulator CpdR
MPDRKILIVDDESAIRSLLCCAVARPGMTVFEADSGQHALSLAAKQAPFELVITDVLMPGMDGIELARKLAEAHYARRFLFMSGYCDQDTMTQRTAGLAITGFLAKPFAIPDFLAAVHRLLDEEQSAAVRALRSRSALRRTRSHLNWVRSLRRLVARLQTHQEGLLSAARAGLDYQAVIVRQIASGIRSLAEVGRPL